MIHPAYVVYARYIEQMKHLGQMNKEAKCETNYHGATTIRSKPGTVANHASTLIRLNRSTIQNSRHHDGGHAMMSFNQLANKEKLQ